MMKIIIFCVVLTVARSNHIKATPEIHFKTEQIKENELFSMMVSAEHFNWTSSITEHYRYRPSLRGKPNLPSWLSFQFSKERHLGYIYGTPPSDYPKKKFDIEIVGLNKQTYETMRIIIPFEIVHKVSPAYKIEMKITNMNWVHLMDKGREENLKSIFTHNLWPESKVDLKVIFMESAVRLGSRVPLKPKNFEGTIVHLGSNAPLSTRLLELSDEIKPLAKLTTCTFKKTTVQNVFQDAGFQVDWCAFKIVAEDSTSTDETSSEASLLTNKAWNAPARDELPERNYSEEIAIAVAIPSVWFAFLVALLTVVLCFQHEKFDEPKLNQPVQMVQYSGTNKTPPVTTTLKSLHDPYDDNLSLGSQSPTGSIFRESSPQMNTFMRPKPPAYRNKYGENSGAMVHFENDI